MSSVIEPKSFDFAVRIVKLNKHLVADKKEYVLSKQILRSGTSVGANVAEAEKSQSRAEFVFKMNIALKEASETDYWIRLLYATDYLTDEEYTSIYSDCLEIEKLLISIVKTTNENRM